MYEKQAEYRKRHRLRVKKAMRLYHIKRKKFINSLKNKPCMDCGGWFEPVQMDFDHRPNEKKAFNISQRSCYKLSYIYREITKCDVVCANCHRLRTYKRGQNATKYSYNSSGKSNFYKL